MSELPADPRSQASHHERVEKRPGDSTPAPFHLDELDAETVLAVLGGARRAGEWTAPELLRVVAVLGGVELDFREARLPYGVTEVRVFALMGGATITVPKEMELQVTAHAVLGGIDHGPKPTDASGAQRDAREESEPRESPLLVISGVAVMGGITIRVV